MVKFCPESRLSNRRGTGSREQYETRCARGGRELVIDRETFQTRTDMSIYDRANVHCVFTLLIYTLF